MSEKPQINFIRLKTLNSYEIWKSTERVFLFSFSFFFWARLSLAQRQPKRARVKGLKLIAFWGGGGGDKLMKLMFEYQNISK